MSTGAVLILPRLLVPVRPALQTTPIYDVVSHLIYAASSRQVSHVWVGGQMLLRDGEFLHADTATILQRAHDWQGRISAGAAVAGGYVQ